MINDYWEIPYSRPELPRELIDAGFTPLLSLVLALRGIKTKQEAMQLVSDEPCLYDPFLLQGMDKAVKRIELAVERGEHIAVYGDYDVDGITATCLLTDYFKSLGLNCTPYIPDRSEEGYGLNCDAIDYLSGIGVSLVVSVDCGITATAEADYARSVGMDMIITDHHECKEGALPDACAVIDPKQDANRYPNTALAGVGVALKLACACAGNDPAVLERYCDLVAVGTVADVMPLTGENRYLVKKGLARLAQSPRPGFAAIFKETGLDINKLNSTSIGFNLAPKLNAAGRLGKAVTAAELLMTDEADTAAALSAELCELNRRRQQIEGEIWNEAKAILSDTAPDAPIVLASETWHQGVIGIAASRLAEYYSLPTIMVCLMGDTGKGSCRSYGGFNLFEALSACSEHLINFGGHALAAGLNIERSKLDTFRAALADYYRSNRPAPQPDIACDLLINDPALLTIDNVRSLDHLEPYGNANPKPCLCISGAVLESVTLVGGGKHLKMRVSLKGESFDAIFFSHTDSELGVHEGCLVDIAFNPQINSYRGSTTVQLMVNALRVHRPEALCAHILSGDCAAYYAAAEYCPVRSDFVLAWRSIQGKDFISADSIEGIIKQCPAGMPPERWCICLMAFLEVGLLRSADGSIFNARCAAINGKADLEATKLIKALREQ